MVPGDNLGPQFEAEQAGEGMSDEGVWHTIGFSADHAARVRAVYHHNGSAFPGYEKPIVGWLTQEQVSQDGSSRATRVVAGVLDNRAAVRQADDSENFLYLRHLDDPKRPGPGDRSAPLEEPYGD